MKAETQQRIAEELNTLATCIQEGLSQDVNRVYENGELVDKSRVWRNHNHIKAIFKKIILDNLLSCETNEDDLINELLTSIESFHLWSAEYSGSTQDSIWSKIQTIIDKIPEPSNFAGCEARCLPLKTTLQTTLAQLSAISSQEEAERLIRREPTKSANNRR